MRYKKRILTYQNLYYEHFFCNKLRIDLFFFVFFSCVVFTACKKERVLGALRINSLLSGRYEVYQLKGRSSNKIVSEKTGYYNRDCMLPFGRYLVVADCSSQSVTINSKQVVEINANSLQFKTPVNPSPGDLFSVQCMMQSAKKPSHQKFLDTYSFNFLGKNLRLLVNLFPVEVGLRESTVTTDSQVLVYHLAAFKIFSRLEESIQLPYFITPNLSFLTMTQGQQLNKWVFLPPGSYQIALGGTHDTILLSEGETRVINASYLFVSLAEKRVQEFYRAHLGRSFDLFINKFHLLTFNDVYPLLPGDHQVSFDGSRRSSIVNAKGGELHTIKANYITVDRGCSLWEWECLGKKEVLVFSQGLGHFFYEGATDVPLVYYEKSVSLSMRSSKGIYYNIPDIKKHKNLKLGTLILKTKHLLKYDKRTELVRVEAGGRPLSGHSQDISFSRTTKMLLFEGEYRVSYYIKKKNGKKESIRKVIQINGGDKKEHVFPYFVSEKKYEKQKHLYSKMRQKDYRKKRQKQLLQELIN